MASSLILGRFDLLDLSSPVILATGFDRGAPVPSVSEIVSTVLDGAMVTGRAASNRQISIPVFVRGTSRLNQAALANEVLAFVDQASWSLTFTPSGGLPVIYSCFRASVKVTSDLVADAEGWQAFTITCEALPYGRSLNPQTATVVGTPPLSIDTYTTLPTVAGGPDSRASAAVTPTITGVGPKPPDGSTVLQVQITNQPSGGYQQFTVTRTGMSVAVSTPIANVRFQAQQTFAYGQSGVAFGTQYKLEVTVSGTTYTAFSSDVAAYQSWTPITFAIALPVGTITGYKITTPIYGFSSFGGGGPFGYVFIDYLAGYGSNAALTTSTKGTAAIVPSVLGSARTPVALAMARADASAFQSWCVHVPPPDMPLAQPLIPFNGLASGTYTTNAAVRYGGTYSVWLSGGFNATGTRTVTITQSAPSGVGSVTATSASVTLNIFTMLYCGEVTLPLAAYPVDAAVTTTFTLAAQASDTIDCILLFDTRGQTIVVDSTAPSYVGAWVDMPPTGTAFGGIYSGATRATATSIGSHVPVAATMMLNPGPSLVVVASPEGPMTCTFTYYPRWLQEATA